MAYFVNGKKNALHVNKNFGDSSIVYMPFVEMGCEGDVVEWVEERMIV